MREGALLDNDVVLKACRYSVGSEVISCTSINGVQPAVLAVARFVVANRVERTRSIPSREAVTAELALFFSKVRCVEPDEAEIQLAAEIEARASELSLNLDAGESQLFAILLKRSAAFLVTGDKRAIRAMAEVAPDITVARERVACFEQLIATIAARVGAVELRERVCRDPRADMAISICFSCSASSASDASVFEGLRSYINDVRRGARGLLIEAPDLVSAVAQENRVR